MPAVQGGETQKDYLNRCIPYVIKNEGLTQEQAAGKCAGMWASSKKKHKGTMLDEHFPRQESGYIGEK